MSKVCYLPATFVQWANGRLAALPNLTLLERTVVRSTPLDGDGRLASARLVRRTPLPGVDEWAVPLSEQMDDWYAAAPSPRFAKRTVVVTAAVFVEASELGDVLMTAGLQCGQGVERPLELSAPGSDDQCGQGATNTFYMELLSSPRPDPAPRGGTAGGKPFSTAGCCCPGSGECDYRGIWTYRRAAAVVPGGDADINVGDVTQQNWGNPSGNDLDNAYLLLPLEAARASVRAGEWTGGLNRTALAMLEQRAWGWFWGYRLAVPAKLGDAMVLSRAASNTTTGLSRLPYLRDTRRSVGLGGFRMQHRDQADGGPFARRPADAVALGDYPADSHGIDTCRPPSYMSSAKTLPFYVPFRALTHEGAANLLVAGKTMAQTFYANSASRLHPCEWSSGVAAGAAAALMVRRNWSSAEMLQHVSVLQALLNSSAVGAPLKWTAK